MAKMAKKAVKKVKELTVLEAMSALGRLCEGIERLLRLAEDLRRLLPERIRPLVPYVPAPRLPADPVIAVYYGVRTQPTDWTTSATGPFYTITSTSSGWIPTPKGT